MHVSEWGMPKRGHKKTLKGNGIFKNVFDRGIGYLGVFIYQNFTVNICIF